MKILIIGGSYFLGKKFIEKFCNKDDIVVINRGNNPLSQYNVVEYKGDRHDVNSIKQIKECKFDVIIDFCAYQESDIKLIFENAIFQFSQYIFVSTVDVYQRNMGKVLDESAPYETKNYGGEVGAYILGKIALEKELKECCQNVEVDYTIIRPSIIYGADNYAPREGIYFHWIKEAGQIIHPNDATGEFQMVYVDDVAKAIRLACQEPEMRNNTYNVCSPEIITYEKWKQILKEVVPKSFSAVEITIENVNENQIPLPFPLTKEESNWYDGKKILEYSFEYTSINQGMSQTANCFSW